LRSSSLEFDRLLRELEALTPVELLNSKFDDGSVPIAGAEVRKTATSLLMDADQVGDQLSIYLFTDFAPNSLMSSNEHSRDVLAHRSEWIGTKQATIAIRGLDDERLLGERRDLQGLHGVYFGSNILHDPLGIYL
jgi:hypothetical protein